MIVLNKTKRIHNVKKYIVYKDRTEVNVLHLLFNKVLNCTHKIILYI